MARKGETHDATFIAMGTTIAQQQTTRSSAVAERPRNVLCHWIFR